MDNKQYEQQKTGKKIMKKLRNGMWVAVAVVGMVAVSSSAVNVGASEANAEEVQAETTDLGVAVSTSHKKINYDVNLWVANTPDEVASEIKQQASDKDQDPLNDYTIVWGDTLSVIAQVTDSTVQELVDLNNIENPDLIYAGDTLTLADGTVVQVSEKEQSSSEEETQVTDAGSSKEETVSTDNNKSDDKKSDDKKSDDNKSDDNKSDDNKSDDKKDTSDSNKGKDEDKVVGQPGGVVEKPSSNGGGNNNNGGKPSEKPDKDEDVTPVEPDGDKEEIPMTPIKPSTPVKPELPEDTEKPVDPDKDPDIDETDPEPVDPGEGEDEDKDDIKVSTKTVSEQIGYKEIRRANPDMKVGEERVVQEGYYGEKVFTYKVTYKNGEVVSEELVSETVTLKPKDTIIEYGIKEEPVITTDKRTEKEQLGYNIVRRENPDMLIGEERTVQEGRFGEKVYEYLLTYEDGKLVSEELVSETVTVKPQDTIIEYGTREKSKVEAILSATDNEKYDLAHNLDWDDEYTYWLTDLTNDELKQIVATVDHAKLNAEFEKLINNHRASLGLNTLYHSADFVQGTQQIANILADYGFIAPAGSPGHTLPNGKPTSSVFSQDLLNRGRGENLAFRYNGDNPYQLISEKYLAETFFNQWMKSEGHRLNMENGKYKGFTLSVQTVTNGNTKYGEKDENGNYVILGDAYDIGTVGVLSLIADW